MQTKFFALMLLVITAVAVAAVEPKPAPKSFPTALAKASATSGPTVPGDRLVPLNIVYPNAAFHEHGGELYDITKEPYHAKGDGVTDDTAAFVAMMDAARDALESSRAKKTAWGSGPTWFYVPNGTYLVSDSIVCSREVKDGFAGLKLIGQDRRKTIIKLKDHSAGFDVGSKKPVLSWSKDPAKHQCGIAWGNELRNLTINTGTGNPGAVGLLFLGANSCSLDNLTIISGDGTGHAGLWFPTWAIQGYFHDLTVTGFDYGIEQLNKAETCPTVEYLTLIGQRKAGIHATEGCPVLRMVRSENTVPVVLIDGASAQVVIIDSLLMKGAADQAALKMDHAQAQLFARDVETSGYGKAIDAVQGTTAPGPSPTSGKSENGHITVAGGTVEEWVSGPVACLGAGLGNIPKRSLRVPIAEVPPSTWESDPTKWATPEDYQGNVQAALDSGKSSVLLPAFTYSYKESLRIPATVNHLDLMQHNVRGPAIDITEASDVPLVIDHPGHRVTVNINQPRTVVFRFGDVCWNIVTDQPVIVHGLALANTGPRPRFCPPNAKIYGRSLNNEIKGGTQFPITGGLMWLLGFKTEGPRECFTVSNGGVLEVLGGYRNQCGNDEGRPMIINDDSHVSFVGFSNMAKIFPEAIWEVRGGETKKIGKEVLPKRSAYGGTYFIPLYVGYDPATLPESAHRRKPSP